MRENYKYNGKMEGWNGKELSGNSYGRRWKYR